MRCPHCQHDNPEGAKFCNDCAHPLLSGTPVAMHPAPPEVSIRRNLAEKIIDSRMALEGERKQISVLFADMKSSMELLVGRDPEEARNILDPMLEQMMEAVHYYEGTVNQVMGDGIMALFGAPIAHEDHAVRACCAALRMQATVARYSEGLRRAGTTPVEIRVGVNSGEVVVRSISSDLHMDYTAVGQTTHLAARMEQMASASASSILITAETLRLAQGRMLANPLGPIAVAGLREPVEAYELIGVGPAPARLQAAATRELGRFVGRDSEMDALADAFDLAARGHGQFVTVVGEAGVGKSRLLHEFVHARSTQGCLVLETGCVSYGRAKGYLPVIEALKTYFAIEERDDARRVRDRVAARLRSLDRTLEATLPALWALLDVLPEDDPWQRLDPGQRRQAILDALRRLVLRESQVRPVVLVFEDVHWIDTETRAVLDALVEGLPAAKLLLLVSHRPEAKHQRRQKTQHRQLRLEPLPRASAGALLDALLGQASELRDLRQHLVERTEGNPLFIEECVSALAETGALAGCPGAYRLGQSAEAKIPATVQAILAARIDRLDPDDKQLLQAAAVIGKDVPFALLRSIAGVAEDVLRSALARLQAAEFLYETALFPDRAFTFKHALAHEVSYASLLGKRRRELHARVVAAIEALYRDRTGEHAEWLAHHALRGGLKVKAISYLNDAGTRAVMRSAPREAIGFFEKALALAAGLPETRDSLVGTLESLVGLGPALMATQGGWDGDVQACYAQALELCDRLGDTSRRFPVLFGLWGCHCSRGEYERAGELAVGLRRVAGDDEYMRLEARHSLWSTAIALGRPKEAQPHLDQGHLLYRQHEPAAWWNYGTHDPGVCCHQMGAIGAWLLGNFDQARDATMRGLQLARRVRHPGTTVLAHQLAAVVYYHLGDHGAANLHAKAASSLGRAHGVMGGPEHASIILARLLVEEGRTEEAIHIAEKSLPASLRAGWPWSASISFGLVAEIYARTGHPAKGLDMLRSLEPKQYDGLYGPELHRLYGHLLLAASPHATDEAETRLREAVALARERQMKSLELRAAMSLAYFLAPRDRRAARAALSVVDDFGQGVEVADLRTARALRRWLA
ncbi:AAA family ATPase [Variovorax sp. J22R24]|uniref:adenylate/guanylate cyclase domain-containing protein n=1 Tax=Variovorax gracilis TaxID=3053502 RepID=UPI002576EA2D|nr:adenylate/guanylate cyclase domain-containing protein [Variovorax sp. J22R24]MDM0108048.1 AAA family ATPase [Variovorax sp. J22R24]